MHEEDKIEYDSFWKSIVENEDGSLNKEQIIKELCDYSRFLKETRVVYCHITNNRISKPNTLAREVIGQYEDILEDRIQEAIEDYKEEQEIILG